MRGGRDEGRETKEPSFPLSHSLVFNKDLCRYEYCTSPPGVTSEAECIRKFSKAMSPEGYALLLNEGNTQQA